MYTLEQLIFAGLVGFMLGLLTTGTLFHWANRPWRSERDRPVSPPSPRGKIIPPFWERCPAPVTVRADHA